MKPTSFIFMVLAAVLLFGGIITCSVAETMAKSQGTAIFEQVKDKNGDYIYKYNIDNEKITKLDLAFTDVDVTIVGSAKESYIELKNFDPYDYATTLSGSTVSVNGNASGLSSVIDMSGGGFRFKGLRYLFEGAPKNNKERSVTVYISDACDLKSLALKLGKGSVSLSNIYNSIDYTVTVNNGSVCFDTVITESVINLDVTASEVKITDSECASISVNATDSKITTDMSNYSFEFIYYDVKTEESRLVYNGSLDDDGQIKVTVSDDLKKCIVKIDATNSEVILLDNSAGVA